jgi:hypothetical protein
MIMPAKVLCVLLFLCAADTVVATWMFPLSTAIIVGRRQREPPRVVGMCRPEIQEDERNAPIVLSTRSHRHSVGYTRKRHDVLDVTRWTTTVVVMVILATSIVAHAASALASATLYESLVPATASSSTTVVVATGASRPLSSESRTWSEIQSSIAQAKDTLTSLVQNWPRAVIDCTYADVPRDLLQQSNKALLLEKASTFALFDKSVSVVSCKTVVGTVRDYLGRTGIGPVASLEATLQAAVYKLVNTDNDLSVDQVEQVLQTVENVERALVRADSLSYAARRDYTALNNFAPALSNDIATDPATNLWQCKLAIKAAIGDLDALLGLLPN